MPKIRYKEINFSPDRRALIDTANAIITEYAAQGFDLTLRQLYYQFVARDIIANRQSEYKRLGDIINDARLAGLIDWTRIVDRTRNLQSRASWDSPSEIVSACASQYHVDYWEGQHCRVEVWIEKDALVGVIEGVCRDLDMPYFSCRGYTSQSEMWAAARRLKRYSDKGQTPIILHFGDHDPSGMDMTRDISDRLQLFMGGMEVRRLALNWDQIEQYNPPPNPAKLSDSRATVYIEKFGSDSWELDALEPRVLADLVRREAESLIEPDAWNVRTDLEKDCRKELLAIAENYPEVAEFALEL